MGDTKTSSPKPPETAPGKKKVMVALSDSQLLHSVFDMALSRVGPGDTLYVVALGTSLLTRSGDESAYNGDKILMKLREEFEKPVVAKGATFFATTKEAKKSADVKGLLVEFSKLYDVDELVVGYSTSKLFQASVATHCATACACNVIVVKKASPHV